jgi:uncharacterized protein YndB with AHSA1/START domain
LIGVRLRHKSRESIAVAEYRLTTIWRIGAPVARVYDALCEPLHWPGWWKGVENVIELDPGAERGVGRRLGFTWKGRLPYALTFSVEVVRVAPLVALEGIASGELEGLGRWLFRERDSVTTVRYDWHVRTTKPWMNALAPFAGRLFEWNHNAIMREGGEGLARLLGAQLIGWASSRGGTGGCLAFD